MPLLYVVGGLVAIGLLDLPGPGPAQAGALRMTAERNPSARVLRGRAARAGQAARRLHGACLRGRPIRARPGARMARAPHLQGLRRRAQDRRWAGRPTRWRCSSSTSPGSWRCTRSSVCRGSCRSTRTGLGAVSPDSSFNTAVSFATNTNWQGYGGETTMSYLTQMLGADRAELRVGGDGHGRRGRADPRLRAPLGARPSATSGSISRGRTLYILLPLSFVLALVLVSQGVVQTFGPYAKVAVVQPSQYDEPVTDENGKPVLDEKGQPRRSKPRSPSRSSRWGRPPRRSRSSSSERTAAASST